MSLYLAGSRWSNLLVGLLGHSVGRHACLGLKGTAHELEIERGVYRRSRLCRSENQGSRYEEDGLAVAEASLCILEICEVWLSSALSPVVTNRFRGRGDFLFGS